jgi:hypothetical protein
MQLNGNEILKLIGLSESDDRVLDLIEALGADRPEIDEYEQMEDVDVEDKYGLSLSFNDIIITEAQRNSAIGGFFVSEIAFYPNCPFLPFGLSGSDNLKTCEEKIGKKANYSSNKDNTKMYWFYEDLGWFTIFFTDETHNEIEVITLKTYEDPRDEGFTFLEPRKLD